MNYRREFEIAFVGLKPGVHEYAYTVKDDFFSGLEEKDFFGCEARVKLFLDKKQGFFQLRFDIDGSVEVDCDRCGNQLRKQLWDEFSLIVKIVDDPDTMNGEESDPDIHYIGRGESHLKIADWVYEFVLLAIPSQRVCNDEEYEGPLCNKAVLEKLKQMERNVEHISGSTFIWKGLENIKGLEE